MPPEPPIGPPPFNAFAESGIRLLIIGGLAMHSYGFQRMTQDCDCAVVAEDVRLLAAWLLREGYVDHPPNVHFTRFFHVGGERPVVDVMRLQPATFEKMWLASR